ncbi:MAG: Pyridoxal-phosphate dependent enzyme [Candidatus Parcubacteria bacterium]|jgi:threonine dehydratase
MKREIGTHITPHESYPELAAAVSGTPAFEKLFLKREDLHPLGSHKGRSIPHMIDKGIAEGIKSFVISSSGNAALAAALYITDLNATRANTADSEPIILDILIGQKIPARKRAKLDALKSEYIRVSAHERPLQMLFAKTQEAGVRGLRQSNDDSALVGYESLGEELMAIPDLRAVFIGASSGTTAQALSDFFLKNAGKNGKPRKAIEVHIVQTTSCHPLSEAFNEDSVATSIGEGHGVSEVSIADAIVDHTALRKNKLVPLIEKTGGSGWIATNEIIDTARNLIEKHAINESGGRLSVSANGALGVAGLMNALYAGRSWDGAVACIICGE